MSEIFFDSTADFYDEMIEIEQQILKRKESFAKLFFRKINFALDIGCGSGADIIALGNFVEKAIGIDISNKMIDNAKKNLKKFRNQNLNSSIKIMKYNIVDFNKEFENKFDLIVSLGNVLPNLNKVDLTRALQNIESYLKPNGEFIFEFLNYEKIYKKNERIIKIREKKEWIYIRFYDLEKDCLGFNILRFKKKNFDENEIYSTIIYPIFIKTAEELLSKFSSLKFEIYGSLSKEQFDVENSNNTVIFGKKLAN